MNNKPLVEKIHDLLPKTQCTQCGFKGCKPYAEAIVAGTPFNQCPPGGKRLIKNLAKLLGEDEKPLNPENGTEKPTTLAWIDESICIGCTKCIQVCPTDAIIGRSKYMHTILDSECNGCDLCIPACPVDCIFTKEADLQPNNLSNTNRKEITDYYQTRYDAKNKRSSTLLKTKQDKYLKAKLSSEEKRKAYIQEALKRVKTKKN